MSVIVSQGNKSDFQKPSTGLVQAVCYAVWDIGLQKQLYKGVLKILPKIIIAWELDELIAEGEYQGKRLVKTKRYSAFLSDKATLKADLEQWRGKAFTKDELKSFDVESMVGVGAMLNLVSKEGEKGEVYINIGSISPLMKSLPSMVPENKPHPAPKWVQKLQLEAVPEGEVEALLDSHNGIVRTESGEEIPF